LSNATLLLLCPNKFHDSKHCDDTVRIPSGSRHIQTFLVLGGFMTVASTTEQVTPSMITITTGVTYSSTVWQFDPPV